MSELNFVTDNKIVTLREAIERRNILTAQRSNLFKTRDVSGILNGVPGVSFGLTNGVFDCLHFGHIYSLDFCKQACQFLTVLVNTDARVKELKGPDRPLQSEMDRARAVASLQCVDAVVLWDELRINNALSKLMPDTWLKGGDYTLDTLDQGERELADELGVKISFIPTLPGFSSTKILKEGLLNS